MTDATRGLKVKVGALVIVAVTLLLGFVVLLGNLSVGARVVFQVEFADSGSMLAGAPVKIAGVRAGRVEAVEFLVDRDARQSAPRRAGEPPINVRVRISVDAEMAPSVREDSEFIITTQGVLGEKYLEIVPGTAARPPWAAEAVIRGSDPPRVDVLFARIDSIMAQVQQALSSENGEVRIGELVRRLTRLTTTLDDLLSRNKDRLDGMVGDLAATTADARALVAALRRGVGDGTDLQAVQADVRRITGVVAAQVGPTFRETRAAVGRADGALAKADSAIEVATALMQGNRAEIDQALKGLPATMARADGILRDVAYVTDGLRAGRGTVGQLMNDQEIFDDLKEMLRNLKRHPWKMLWRE